MLSELFDPYSPFVTESGLPLWSIDAAVKAGHLCYRSPALVFQSMREVRSFKRLFILRMMLYLGRDNSTP